MKLPCYLVQDLLPLYKDHVCDEQTSADVAEHLSDCAACSALLAEMAADPLLRRYDTIIVDEAHERSLNIDFILGYLGRLLPQRRDLKVIITSATIDSQRFADHFEKQSGKPVPVIEVSGRAYPVEVRYRPLSADLAAPDTAAVGDEDAQAP